MTRVMMKNYRSFTDESPLVVDFSGQFTALVGPNNSGKSAFLISLFDLRSVWQTILNNTNSLPQTAQNGLTGVFRDRGTILDSEEVFSNSNNRPITIELHTGQPSISRSGPAVTHLVATSERGTNLQWSVTAFSGTEQLMAPSPPTWIGPPHQKIRMPSGRLFDCSAMMSSIADVAGTMYVGPYRNIISENQNDYYDLEIGNRFIGTWHNWKSGPSKKHNMAIQSISENIRNIFKFDRLEINPSAIGNTLHVILDGKPYRLTELGAGLAQFIIVFANAAIKQPRVLLIDEPELNLHPTLQSAFLTALGGYASHKVIFATHSIGLARTVAEQVYSFRKVGNHSVVRPLEATPSYAEYLGEMSFSAFQELGYESILLVEGPNDVIAVQQLLRHLSKDGKVVIFPLGGNQMAAARREVELAEIRRLSKSIFALVDSERITENGDPAPERIEFEKVCAKLRIPICITKLRAIENYFPDRAVKATFGDKYRALGPYERLSDNPNGWAKAANWRITREMTKDEFISTDVGQFLDRI